MMSALCRVLFAAGFASSVAACSSRAELPPPRTPLSASLDEAFRAQAPADLPNQGSWVAPAVTTHVLPNGLRLFIVERHTVPMVSLVYVNPHAARDPSGYPAGLAMLTADAMAIAFHDAEGREVWDARVSGRAIAAYAGTAYGAFSLSVVEDELAEAIEVMARTLSRPLLSDAAVEAAYREQARYLFDGTRTAGGLLASLKMSLLFGSEHRWAVDNRDWAEQVATLQTRDVQRFYADAFRPELGALVIVGAVHAQDVIARVEAELGGWQARPGKPPALTSTRIVRAEQPVIALLDGGSTTQVCVLHPLPAARHRDVHALGVLHSVIAGGWSSQLMSSLRHDMGRAYSVQGGTRWYRDSGYMEIRIEVPNRRVGRTVREILERLDQARSQDLAAADVEGAKAAYLVQLLPRRNDELAWSIADAVSAGLPPTTLADAVQQVQALGPADLRAAAAEHLASDRASVLTFGNFYEFDSAFFRLGDVRQMAPLSRSETKR